jgi:hypothetical protein
VQPVLVVEPLPAHSIKNVINIIQAPQQDHIKTTPINPSDFIQQICCRKRYLLLKRVKHSLASLLLLLLLLLLEMYRCLLLLYHIEQLLMISSSLCTQNDHILSTQKYGDIAMKLKPMKHRLKVIYFTDPAPQILQ